MKRVALITDAPYHKDVRAQRVFRALTAEGYEVGVLDQGFSVESTRRLIGQSMHYPTTVPAGGFPKMWWHINNRALPLVSYRNRMAQRIDNLQEFAPDAIWCINIFDLEAAAQVAHDKGIPLIYESYEYWPEHLISKEYQLPLTLAHHLQPIETEHAPSVKAFVTVSPLLGEWYRDLCGMPEATVIYNAHISNQRIERPSSLAQQPLRLVHSGQASINRNVEVAVAAIGNIEGAELTVIGYGSGFEKLKARMRDRAFFKEAVPHEELSAELSQYDVGLILTDGSAQQTDGALPNKLFDYMGAGLAVIAVRTAALESFENVASFTRFIDAPKVDAFAKAANELASSRVQVAKMRDAAFEESRKYTEAIIEKSIVDVMRHACG